jgi:5-methylcytosine-specific restriction endonuclease McrA
MRLRQSGRYLRDCVYLRDRGVCSICNLDTSAIAKAALLLSEEERKIYLTDHGISLRRRLTLRRHGGGLWDADHIVPVKDGGGQCGMENIRTLCMRCHKTITFAKK